MKLILVDPAASEKIIEVLNKSFPNDVQFKNLIRSFQVNYPVSNIRKVRIICLCVQF